MATADGLAITVGSADSDHSKHPSFWIGALAVGVPLFVVVVCVAAYALKRIRKVERRMKVQANAQVVSTQVIEAVELTPAGLQPLGHPPLALPAPAPPVVVGAIALEEPEPGVLHAVDACSTPSKVMRGPPQPAQTRRSDLERSDAGAVTGPCRECRPCGGAVSRGQRVERANRSGDGHAQRSTLVSAPDGAGERRETQWAPGCLKWLEGAFQIRPMKFPEC